MKNFLLALQFFPYALGGVVAVEQIAYGSPGATKKRILLDSVLAASKVGQSVPVAKVAFFSTLIDTIVTALNVSGVFNKGVAPVLDPSKLAEGSGSASGFVSR